jgi:phage gp29-like protein
VDLNFGPQRKYPWLSIGRAEAKNAQLMVDAVAKLGSMGFKVRQADVREAVGFAEPQDNDELFVAPSPGYPGFTAALPGAVDPGAPPERGPLDPAVAEISLNGIQVQAVLDVIKQLIAREIPESVGAGLIGAVGIPEDRAQKMAADAIKQPAPPVSQQPAIAAARVRAELLAQELEGGADAIALAAQRQAISEPELLKPVVDEIQKLAALSGSYEEFRRRLAAARGSLDMTPLGERLALLTFQTLAGGIVGDTVKS